jgi:predicted aldo/keto reductase-like oxidoreductase
MPKSLERLSILGYGCMRFPEKKGNIDVMRTRNQIYKAIDEGINYFDTAYPYHMGQAEPFLGKILDKEHRARIYLATKLPPAAIRKRADMDYVLNNQLKRLNTDSIDYYLLHGLEENSWHKLLQLDVLDFLDYAQRSGRIRFAGFSFHGHRNIFKEIVDAYNWHFCQLQYNYFDQDTQAGTEGLEYAAFKGLGIIVMEPLRGGLLTRHIPPEVTTLWNLAETRRTPAEWALRWVWDRPEVTVVLSGMNDEAQIAENVRIAAEVRPNSLSALELALIEVVRKKYQELMQIGCTGCHYCMPCPRGVDIPACFDFYNRVFSFGEGKFHNLVRYALQLGGLEKKPHGFASQCVGCGMCVAKCPQHLDIPYCLKLAADAFETLTFSCFRWYGKHFFAKLRGRKKTSGGQPGNCESSVGTVIKHMK